MSTKIRIIAQIINTVDEQILSQKTLHEKEVIYPESISELGYNHEEQIEIIQHTQDFYLQPQSHLMNNHFDKCPQCGKRTRKQGAFMSEFHSIYTDHKIELQRRTCSCGWKSKNSIHHHYGSSIHPELAKIQCSLGAEHSFHDAEKLLELKCKYKRAINNDDRVRHTVTDVGHKLDGLKKDNNWVLMKTNSPAEELIMTIDGGHIKTKEKDKRSIEELIVTVYNPKNVINKDKHHHKIIDKTYVGSALDDELKSIKTLTLNACLREGLSQTTKITALSDGASNCIEVVKSLSNGCGSLTLILDWFHIGKKFKNAEHVIPDELKEAYEASKWHLWHGHSKTSIIRLEQLCGYLDDIGKGKIIHLMAYIKNNERYIINYHARKIKGLVYTSQTAESSVENVINERQKHNKKMQWTREGAHAVLQIRTSQMSGSWKDDWDKIRPEIYKNAA